MEILFTRPTIRLTMIGISMLAALTGILAPFFQKEFIDHLTANSQSLEQMLPQLAAWLPQNPLIFLLLAFVCILISLMSAQLVNFLGAREALVIQRRWSQRLYEKILALRADSLGGRPVGEIVSVYATDLTSATILLEQSLPQALSIIFPLLFAPILIQQMFHVPMSRILAFIFFIVILNILLAMRQSRFFWRYKNLAADRIGLVNEWVQNIRTLRILGWTAGFEHKIFKIREVETRNRVAMLNNGQTMNAIASTVTFALNISLISTLIASSAEHVSAGSLMALLWIVAIFLTRSFRMMPWFFTFLFDATTSIQRIAKLSALENENPKLQGFEQSNLNKDYALQIENLSLQIDQHKILDQISFSVKQGEFLTIVGEVGAGKSMLLLSLLGETGAEYTHYSINKLPVRDMPMRSLHENFAFVPQEGFIMSSSLRENVAFAYETSREQDHEIRLSLNQAQFSVAAERLPEGLETEIGERGVNLSGGQKQRISLARVDFYHAPILLLDDCLSALDVDTEKKILDGLILGQWQKRTRILVTHRLTVLDKADRVLFLKQGRLIAQGTYTELMKSNVEFQDFTASLRTTS